MRLPLQTTVSLDGRLTGECQSQARAFVVVWLAVVRPETEMQQQQQQSEDEVGQWQDERRRRVARSRQVCMTLACAVGG